MTLAIGARLGVFEVTGSLGAGGMGEVYRARDSRLGRDVAVKVLPAEFAADPERLARFEREARTLASLSHPNIAVVHGLEDSGAIRALVMELVEGPTLAEIIGRAGHGLPVDEALPIAQQMVGALEAAHEHGIIHRDLKPANIKVRPDGVVKVLDFGLAKAIDVRRDFSPAGRAGSEGQANPVAVSQLPTITSPALLTGAGMILGTAAYMAPEQAKGRAVDRRADVWAFGCVLFEMLTGTRAFGGDDVSDTLASVLRAEPAWERLPAETPPSIRRLLRRCLSKDVAQRLPDIGSARLEIADAGGTESGGAPGVALPVGRLPRARRLMWAASLVAALVLGATAAGVYLLRTRPATTAQPVRLELATGPQSVPWAFAVSPDGSKVAYSAQGQWWTRDLAAEAPVPVPGTDDFEGVGNGGATWSPDGRALLLVDRNHLKRVDLDRGAVRELADVFSIQSTAWGSDDTVLFSPGASGPLMRVDASGGESRPATVLASGHVAHRFPSFLQDGRRFIFLAVGTPDTRGIYLGSLDSAVVTKLFHSDSKAIGAAPDSIVFMRGGALMAQRIDSGSANLVGNATPLAANVVTAYTAFNAIGASASPAGHLAYRARGPVVRLAWFDREGRRLGTVGEPIPALALVARTYRSEDDVVLQLERQGEVDLWSVDATRSTMSRLTADLYRDQGGTWSPDRTRMVFSSERNGVYDIFERAVDATAGEKLLLSSPEPKIVFEWSPDGKHLLYRLQSQVTGDDVMALPLDGDPTPIPVVQTRFDEEVGGFSPDGRWVSYRSDETGRAEIFIRPFLGPGPAVQVSRTGSFPAGGSAMTIWRRDGRELYYRSPEGAMMAVPLSTPGGAIVAGTPTRVFRGTDPGVAVVASGDGQRFLVVETVEDVPPVTILLNWPALLR